MIGIELISVPYANVPVANPLFSVSVVSLFISGFNSCFPVLHTLKSKKVNDLPISPISVTDPPPKFFMDDSVWGT